jgi:hypothetical protein
MLVMSLKNKLKVRYSSLSMTKGCNLPLIKCKNYILDMNKFIVLESSLEDAAIY